MRAEEARLREGRLASAALRLGVRLSAGLMALAVAWSLLTPEAVHPAQSLAFAGVAVLVAAPFLRVLSLVAAFARNRQGRMLAVSGAVLALLLAGVALGWMR